MAPKFVVDVSTGQRENREPTSEEQGKDPAAVAMGRKGKGRKHDRRAPIRDS